MLFFHHRQVLEDECEQCRQDIAFLQSCLDGEHEFISATLEEELKPQPTLKGTRIYMYIGIRIWCALVNC